MALIEITLTIDGQAGPFDLFSNVDNYVQAFDTQVPAASLTAGYIVVAPAGTSTVRVCSTGVCTNCVDIPTNCPTTTTTTSSSTSTTTSTSTSTSTTTTEQPPSKLNWELITNTPSSLIAADPQSSNLKIDVNGVNVVDATITGNASSQTGTIQIFPGDVVSATIDSDRTGVYNFINTIQKDGVLYQAQDVCTFCTDSFVTNMSPDYTGAGVGVAFSFVADTVKELTTTTTTSSSTSTTTTSTSSSTTTTTTTCDCSLNGGSAIVTSGTTTTKFAPATTTTTTSNGPALNPAMLSTSSSPNQAISICDFPIGQFVWKNNLNVPQVGDILYTSINGGNANLFNGGNQYWHYQRSITGPGSSDDFSVLVNTSGVIQYAAPCNA
tara:strand:- start:181 stop:1323 length:1143 start_codon:yes stop_codon:yes gene_type:complete